MAVPLSETLRFWPLFGLKARFASVSLSLVCILVALQRFRLISHGDSVRVAYWTILIRPAGDRAVTVDSRRFANPVFARSC